MSNQENKNYISLKAYTVGELADIYGVDWRTFKRWLVPFKEEIGERNGRYYTINQVKIIFEKIGLPCRIVLD